MKHVTWSLLVIVLLPVPSAFAQVNTQRGSVLGGLAGAAAGVAIGEHNDEPLAGALIGGAVGLVTGATLGNARDRQIAENRAYQYRAYQQQQLQQQQQMARSVTPLDVITMARRGVTDAVMINHIQTNGVRQELQIADVITMHENGVSEQVISAMQRAQVGSASRPAPNVATPVYQPAAPPTIVEQYVAPPRYYYAPPPWHGGPRHHYHRGPGMHFSYGR